MNRSFLRWFYVAVQFVMLAVSIPKVATLFHAYDMQPMGPLIGGIDLRSWMVGIVIDLCSAVTTMAALAKFEATRNRFELLAPGLIIAVCTSLSVLANYEDAATLHPEQYAHVSLFENPALLVNPILISAPPVLVLLLILLVPSIMAQPRIKSAAEIEAQTAEQEALIAAQGRIKEARARANAKVREVRLKGAFETLQAVTNRQPDDVLAPSEIVEANPPPDDDPLPPTPSAPAAKMTRAMWQAMKLPERVLQSGLITPQEVAEVLGISLSHGRNLVKEVETGVQRVDGRSGVSYSDLIDALYDRRTKDSYTWARKLESTLGVRKRVRQLQVVPDEELAEVSAE